MSDDASTKNPSWWFAWFHSRDTDNLITRLQSSNNIDNGCIALVNRQPQGQCWYSSQNAAANQISIAPDGVYFSDDRHQVLIHGIDDTSERL